MLPSMPHTRFNPFSAIFTTKSNDLQMVKCYQRHLQVLHTLPRMLDAVGDHRIHIISQPWKNECTEKETGSPWRTSNLYNWMNPLKQVCLYINNMYIYIPKNGICMEKVNSSTIRFSGTLCSVSHPLAVTRLPSPPCQILRPDGSLVVTAHQVDGPILIDPPQKSYTLITAFSGSNTVSSKTHPFAKKHEPSAKWVVEFATPHPIRIQ